MDEYVDINIELAWNNTVDKNKRLFGREEMDKALNEKRLKTLLDTGNMMIECPYCTQSKDLVDFCNIDPRFVIGNVLSIDLDKREAVIRIKKEMQSVKEKYVLAFAYLGTVDYVNGIGNVKNIKIVRSGLLLKSVAATNYN